MISPVLTSMIAPAAALALEALEAGRRVRRASACVALRSSDSRTGFRLSGSTVKPGDVRIGQALLVEIFLHAGDADIVLVDEADHMRADRPVGIDALVLGQEADAGQAEMEDFLLLLRRDLALDPDEALLRAEPLAQLLGVDVGQNGGDQLDRLVLVDDAARLGEHRHGLDVGGEDLAVAVEQIGPRARGRLVGRDFQGLRRIVRQAERDELGADAGIGDEQAEREGADARRRPVEPGRTGAAARRPSASPSSHARRAPGARPAAGGSRSTPKFFGR